MKNSIIYLLLLVPFIGTAQDKKPSKYKSTIGVGFYGGVSSVAAKSTNDMLHVLALPLLKTDAPFSLSGSIYLGLHNPFFIDITSSGLNKNAERNGVNIQQKQTNYDVNFSYTLLHSKSHFIYPSIGFGWQANEFKLLVPMGNVSFGQSLFLPGNEKSYQNKSLHYINIKAAYDYALDEHATILASLRAGYRIGITNRGWKSNGDELANSPKMNASGYYVMLGLTIKITNRK